MTSVTDEPRGPAAPDTGGARTGVPGTVATAGLPGPLPVTWRLSRRRGWRGLYAVIPFGYVGHLLWGRGDYVLAWLALVTAGALVVVSAWFLLVPGRVRLDEDGVRWGRRGFAAWERVADFRLNEVDHDLPRASTYVLPRTPEEADRHRFGVEAPKAVHVPAWVTETTPWGAVSLLNRYRDWALGRHDADAAVPDDSAAGSTRDRGDVR